MTKVPLLVRFYLGNPLEPEISNENEKIVKKSKGMWWKLTPDHAYVSPRHARPLQNEICGGMWDSRTRHRSLPADLLELVTVTDTSEFSLPIWYSQLFCTLLCGTCRREQLMQPRVTQPTWRPLSNTFFPTDVRHANRLVPSRGVRMLQRLIAQLW